MQRQIQNVNILVAILNTAFDIFSLSAHGPVAGFGDAKKSILSVMTYKGSLNPGKSCPGNIRCLQGILHQHRSARAALHKSCSQPLACDPHKRRTRPEHSLLQARSLQKGQNKSKHPWARIWVPEASEGTEEGLKPLTASSHAKSSYSFHTQCNTANIQEGFDGWCSMVQFR